MMKEMNDNNLIKQICYLDNRVSLDAKGLYYSLLLNSVEENKSFFDIIKETNEDIEYISKLLMELIKYNYIYVSVKNSDNTFITINNVVE